MNTDCLNETEFHQLHTYNFHIKFYDRSIGCIRSEIWEGCSKEEVILQRNIELNIYHLPVIVQTAHRHLYVCNH